MRPSALALPPWGSARPLRALLWLCCLCCGLHCGLIVCLYTFVHICQACAPPSWWSAVAPRLCSSLCCDLRCCGSTSVLFSVLRSALRSGSMPVLWSVPHPFPSRISLLPTLAQSWDRRQGSAKQAAHNEERRAGNAEDAASTQRTTHSSQHATASTQQPMHSSQRATASAQRAAHSTQRRA